MQAALAAAPAGTGIDRTDLERRGRLDAAQARTLERAVRHALASADGGVAVVDLADLEFLGASTVAVLVEACFVARQQGRRLRLANGQDQPLSVLAACGVLDMAHQPAGEPGPATPARGAATPDGPRTVRHRVRAVLDRTIGAAARVRSFWTARPRREAPRCARSPTATAGADRRPGTPPSGARTRLGS